ncbi:hypothetical protein ACFQGT_06340 [Natrialbaceae archaeon GCM10025810]|uniref:DUF7511 domain-containing protein n=1 Tax=Halovalidus salilacus TaxID=3075124 RepID=UPI00361E5EF7
MSDEANPRSEPADELPTTVSRESNEPGFEHVVVENDDEPDECAIFPREATEVELMTTWISASGDAFTDLASVR